MDPISQGSFTESEDSPTLQMHEIQMREFNSFVEE